MPPLLKHFDLFISRGLYGHRPSTHLAARRIEPGWYWLEIGSITVEISIPVRIEALSNIWRISTH